MWSGPPFSCIWSSMKRNVIVLGNIEGPYPGAWNFQGGAKRTISTAGKNIVMLSCLVWKIRSPQFHIYGLLWSEKSLGSETSNTPTQGPNNFRVESFGVYAPCKNIVMLSCLVWEISPPFSCISSYIKRKDIGLGNIEDPNQGDWNFQWGVFGTIYALCKIIVILSCLVWKIGYSHFHVHVYLLIWSEKTSGLETSKAPTQRPEISRVDSLRQFIPPCKNKVMLSSLVWEIYPSLFMYMVLYEAKSYRFGNIKGPYPGAWNFQRGAKGTIYAPCKNIVMLSCLVWKIRSPHFHVYDLLWNEKSSGSETSNAPTQWLEIFRVGLSGQSTPPVKI